MNFFKLLFKSDTANFDEITPEFLEIYRTKYIGEEYLKWLKNKYGKLQAAVIVKEETSGNVPPGWNDKVKLLEQAIEQEKYKI